MAEEINGDWKIFTPSKTGNKATACNFLGLFCSPNTALTKRHCTCDCWYKSSIALQGAVLRPLRQIVVGRRQTIRSQSCLADNGGVWSIPQPEATREEKNSLDVSISSASLETSPTRPPILSSTVPSSTEYSPRLLDCLRTWKGDWASHLFLPRSVPTQPLGEPLKEVNGAKPNRHHGSAPPRKTSTTLLSQLSIAPELLPVDH